MAASNPPVNAVQYIVYIALQDMANPGSYKANPTLASGDVKISIDGGAFANIDTGGTLPAVTPAAGIAIKVTVSTTQMTGDNIFIQFIDQTNPKEWADYAFVIQTVRKPWLAPTTNGNDLDVSAGGEAGLDWANIGSPTTAQGLTGTTIATSQVVASVTGAVGSVTGNVNGNVVGSVASVAGNVGGNVVGSVASVAGNVGGNVVGNVNGNVAGSVNSVVTDVGITQGGADKVWLSAARTLTSFGTLVADIWASASRTLTGIASGVIASGELDNIADAIFKRDWTAITGEAARSFLNAGRKLMNKVGFAAPTLTVYKEDDATPAYTQTVAQDAAQTPFKSLDTN